ncbi:MAG: hypothetical protein KBT70_01745 [Roseovarius sp.]|uniref:hypothetical protein n=1 Tax=Roseovarius sp. TaxID=1486281 RepID=UPI001B432CEE|nr:hypothetical protein [Roseovarius sp.]MBQ0748896.1 hypothetical protein [Roseovarius sp.]
MRLRSASADDAGSTILATRHRHRPRNERAACRAFLPQHDLRRSMAQFAILDPVLGLVVTRRWS